MESAQTYRKMHLPLVVTSPSQISLKFLARFGQELNNNEQNKERLEVIPSEVA